MPRAKKNVAKKLTPAQVVDKLMEMIAAFPDMTADLPEKLRSREHWKKTLLSKSPWAAHVMEMLVEMPGFTNQAPANRSREALRKVFAGYMGFAQVPQILRSVDLHAGFKRTRRPRIVYWRDAFGPEEAVQRVRPKESNAWLPNPHRGTTTFQRFQGDDTYPSFITSDTHGPTQFPRVARVKDNVKYIPRTTLTYCRWPWAWLEPEKGKFNWKLIDGTLRSARERGQTAQIRFQPFTIRVDSGGAKGPGVAQGSFNADDYGAPARSRKTHRHPPGTSVNVPDWYWDTGAKWMGGSKGDWSLGAKEPDGNDPMWLKHFGEFVRAFAERYDGHPDLESIDIAYGGFWGEGGGNCSYATAAKLVDAYMAGFRKTHLMTMLGTPGCAYAAKVSARTGRPVGWRADCFGDLHLNNHPEVPEHLGWNHTYDAYPKEIALCRVQDAWKTAPVTMETCGNVSTWVMEGYDFDRIVHEGYSYHMSVFMPKNAFFPERVMDQLIEFDKKIGYRFLLRQMLLPIQAKGGEKIQIDTFTENVGCAPIYRPYKLALRFTQGRRREIVHFREDIRKWLPGHNWFREEIVFPRGFERGEVKLAIGIVDDTDTPRVWFTIDAKTDQGWHPLTNMDCMAK